MSIGHCLRQGSRNPFAEPADYRFWNAMLYSDATTKGPRRLLHLCNVEPLFLPIGHWPQFGGQWLMFERTRSVATGDHRESEGGLWRRNDGGQDTCVRPSRLLEKVHLLVRSYRETLRRFHNELNGLRPFHFAHVSKDTCD